MSSCPFAKLRRVHRPCTLHSLCTTNAPSNSLSLPPLSRWNSGKNLHLANHPNLLCHSRFLISEAELDDLRRWWTQNVWSNCMERIDRQLFFCRGLRLMHLRLEWLSWRNVLNVDWAGIIFEYMSDYPYCQRQQPLLSVCAGWAQGKHCHSICNQWSSLI